MRGYQPPTPALFTQPSPRAGTWGLSGARGSSEAACAEGGTSAGLDAQGRGVVGSPMKVGKAALAVESELTEVREERGSAGCARPEGEEKEAARAEGGTAAGLDAQGGRFVSSPVKVGKAALAVESELTEVKKERGPAGCAQPEGEEKLAAASVVHRDLDDTSNSALLYRPEVREREPPRRQPTRTRPPPRPAGSGGRRMRSSAGSSRIIMARRLRGCAAPATNIRRRTGRR